MSNAIAAVMQWASLVQPMAEAASIDWRVPMAIIWVESRGDPTVGDAKRGIGLGGIVPGDKWTVRELKVPRWNISAIISRLWEAQRYVRGYVSGGDMRHALIAYHLGETGGREAGWLDSQDGSAYLAAFTDAWGLLFPGEPLPWEAKPLRGEKEEP